MGISFSIIVKQVLEMMTRTNQVTANNSFLHLKVGLEALVSKTEEGIIREKAIRLYWGLYQLLHQTPALKDPNDPERVLRLSFEDDFDPDFDDDAEDGAFVPIADLLKEEDDVTGTEEDREPTSDLHYK